MVKVQHRRDWRCHLLRASRLAFRSFLQCRRIRFRGELRWWSFNHPSRWWKLCFCLQIAQLFPKISSPRRLLRTTASQMHRWITTKVQIGNSVTNIPFLHVVVTIGGIEGQRFESLLINFPVELLHLFCKFNISFFRQ